jgi:hypothetical protein
MSRTFVSASALVVLAACSAVGPLSEGFVPTPEPAGDAPIVGGKGFIAPRAQALPSPLSLTASDGSGLELVSMNVEAEVDDPIARTRMELRFDNPKNEVIEGKLQLSLPPGASIVHFAMMVGGRWQDAAVVERQQGRVAYEESLHRKRDPALLEKSSGNRFGVRVFPIPARGQVHLRVTYTQAFAEPSQPYRLALRGLPRVRDMVARVGVLDAATGERIWTSHELHRRRPTEDLVVSRGPGPSGAWRHGKHVMARVVVPATHDDVVPSGGYTVMFDTSASRAVDYSAKVERLEALLATLAERSPASTAVTVVPFDQAVGSPVYRGPLSGYTSSNASAALRRRGALGASDVGRALRAAAKAKHPRVVLVTDGMLTAGARDSEGLRKSLERLASAGARRLDVIAGQDLQDDAVLHNLVTTGLPRDGVVIDATQPPEAVAMRLLRPTARPMKVHVEGATAVFPSTLSGVQQGDAVLVYAQMPGRPKVVRVGLQADDEDADQQILHVSSREDGEFERAWMRAHVEDRLEQLRAGGQVDRAALADVSVKHGILNDLTALIVLETHSDYARFGFEKTVDPTLEDAARASQRQAGSVPMDTFKSIPVGSTVGRDFTQVVEVSATASRDAAGISLGGSTGAASRYGVEGGGISAPPRAYLLAKALNLRGSPRRRREVRKSVKEVEYALQRCYFDALAAEEVRGGSMVVALRLAHGFVRDVDLVRDRLGASEGMRVCLDAALREQSFASVEGRFRIKMQFHPGEVPERPVSMVSGIPGDGRTVFDGAFSEVQLLIKRGKAGEAERLARGWLHKSPDDLMALTALGRAAEARGKTQLAARAYGSIAELHPSSAPMLRFAAGRLQALGAPGLRLATDVLEEAQRQRPDHPSSHRALAWALVQRKQYAKAFDALVEGYDRDYPDGRFIAVKAGLAEELEVVGAAWAHAEPKRRTEIVDRLAELGLAMSEGPSLRFVLMWETDTNDVDLHIRDGRGNEAYYGAPTLPSGGSLLGDVTTGFGPETFVIEQEPEAYPYDVYVHYYARGPMGYGMGHVQTVFHDGRGTLEIGTLPFVVMKDDATLGVGSVTEQ